MDEAIRHAVDLDKLGPQFGFRAGKSTRDCIFIAKQLLSRAKKKGRQATYAAFIDFTGAFDRVDRQLLFEQLKQAQVPQQWLSLIKQMYEGVNACLAEDTQARLFAERGGVKQGDPLSPLLFILFLADLPDRLSDALSTHRQLQQRRRGRTHTYHIHPHESTLLFADDVTLLAETRQELQILLDTLSKYAAERCLTVSLDKTKVMAFGPKNLARQFDSAVGVHCRGTQLERVSDFTFLGATLSGALTITPQTETHTPKHSPWVAERNHVICRARSAHFACIARSARLGHAADFATHIALYKTWVVPVMTYASETSPDSDTLHNGLDDLQLRYIRWLVRAPKNTPRRPTLYEAGLLPISELVFTRRITFAASLRARSSVCLAKQTYTTQLQSWLTHKHNNPNAPHQRRCWFDTMQASLRSLRHTDDEASDAVWQLTVMTLQLDGAATADPKNFQHWIRRARSATL